MIYLFSRSVFLLVIISLSAVVTAAQSDRPKIAVMMPELIATPNMPDTQRDELARFIQADIEAAFFEIRTFDVFARDEAAGFARQREVLLAATSGTANTDSLIEKGNPVVDYVILPVVRVARFDRQINNAARGVWIVKDSGYVELSVRLLDVATQQITSTAMDTITYAGRATNLPTDRLSTEDRQVDARVTSELSRLVGLFVAKDTSFRIDPPTIVAYANGEVYINKGPGAGLEVGDYFEVFAPGDDIIVDGIKLGTTETKLGMVMIDRFQPLLSIGRFVGGGLAAPLEPKMLKGAFMRPVQAPEVLASDQPMPGQMR